MPLLRSGDIAVLVSTPYMDEAMRCTRIGFLRGGHMISEGTPAELRHTLDGRIVELAGAPTRVLVEQAQLDPAVETVERFGNRYHLRVAAGQTAAVVDRLRSHIVAAGGQVEALRPIEPQLEDVFIALAETVAPDSAAADGIAYDQRS